MILKNYLTLAAMLFLSAMVNAQDLPPVETFYTPTINNEDKISLSPSSGTTDDTNRIQNVINQLSNINRTLPDGSVVKGGVLTLKNGTYRIRGLRLRSNVHVICFSGVTIIPFRTGDMIIADGTTANGCTDCEVVENFSFIGPSDTSRFTIDIASKLEPGNGSRSFKIGNARNFRIANINVIDNNTQFPTVEFLPGKTFGTVGPSDNRQQRAAAPTRGLIENITGVGYNPGWGVIQIQVGNTLYFRNIKGTGGATIRMESGLGTGLSTLNTENRTITKMNEIWGRFIEVRNGRCAVFASPHTHIQGFFDMRNITAVSSEFAVFLAKGFRTIGNPSRPDETNFPIGTFLSNRSTVRNITTTYGDGAQDRLQELRYMPCAIRSGATPTLIPGTSVFYPGPSVAPIYNIANSGGDGSYNVNIIGLTANGYRDDVVDIIDDQAKNDFENCVYTPIEDKIWIPNAIKNTDNPLQEGDGSEALSTDELHKGNKQISISPNPATDAIRISNALNSSISIYSATGALVKQISKLESSPIDISDLNTGLYFIRVNSISKVLKLYVK